MEEPNIVERKRQRETQSDATEIKRLKSNKAEKVIDDDAVVDLRRYLGMPIVSQQAIPVADLVPLTRSKQATHSVCIQITTLCIACLSLCGAYLYHTRDDNVM